MSIGVVPCEGCGHRRGLHKHGGQCAEAGCGCLGFVGTTLAEPAETDQPGKVVQVFVPDGFEVTIALTRVREEGS